MKKSEAEKKICPMGVCIHDSVLQHVLHLNAWHGLKLKKVKNK